MTSVRTSKLVVALLAIAGCAGAQTDFDDYVASIRESGMSESAASHVRGTASILAGSTTFRATRSADGSVGQSYGPPPGGRGLRERRQTSSVMEAWTAFLKQQADTDHSGFVTTKEGFAVRELVELGLVADQLKLRSLEELEKAPPLNSSEADLVAYAELRAEAIRQGLEGLPALQPELNRSPVH